MKLIILALLGLAAYSATAQSTYIYDKNGGYAGRITPGGSGSYYFYDRNGGYAGRSQSVGGSVYQYDHNGGYAGRVYTLPAPRVQPYRPIQLAPSPLSSYAQPIRVVR